MVLENHEAKELLGVSSATIGISPGPVDLQVTKCTLRSLIMTSIRTIAWAALFSKAIGWRENCMELDSNMFVYHILYCTYVYDTFDEA